MPLLKKTTSLSEFLTWYDLSERFIQWANLSYSNTGTWEMVWTTNFSSSSLSSVYCVKLVIVANVVVDDFLTFYNNVLEFEEFISTVPEGFDARRAILSPLWHYVLYDKFNNHMFLIRAYSLFFDHGPADVHHRNRNNAWWEYSHDPEVVVI